MEKIIVKALAILMSYLTLIVLPFSIFQNYILDDLTSNEPIEHLWGDIFSILGMFIGWWVYWEIVYKATYGGRKKYGHQNIREK